MKQTTLKRLMGHPHICILAPVHNCNDIRVFYKEASSLANWKYRVTLYTRGKNHGMINNVQIKILPSYRKRIIRFLSLPKVFWSALKEKADFYHIHNPDTLLVGFALKLTGKTVIYDVHEDFTYRIFSRRWINPLFRPLLSSFISFGERMAGFLFDAVVVSQNEVQSRIGERAVVIRNAPIANGSLIDKAYSISKSIKKDNFFRVVYVGRIGRVRGLMEMVKAMGILNQKVPARIWLIGEGNLKELKEAKQDCSWRYVDYLGQLSQETAFAHMIKSDAGLVTIHDVADHRYTSANKIYEYQRFALPFVASNFNKWKDQLSAIDSGIFVNPLDPGEIAQALHWIAMHPKDVEKMGKRGQSYILNDFNWETESKNLYKLYSRLRK